MPTPLTRPVPTLSADLSDAFLVGFAKWGLDHKTNPRLLLAVSAYEAGGVNPKAANPAGAYGLFQWTSAARGTIGWPADRPMSDIAKLSSFEQLPLIDKYFSRFAPYATIGDAYQTTFLPATRAWGHAPDLALAYKTPSERPANVPQWDPRWGSEANIYAQNATLDADKDGKITVGDLENTALAATRRMGKRWDEILARLAWAESTLGISPPAKGFEVWPIVAIGVGVGLTFALLQKG